MDKETETLLAWLYNGFVLFLFWYAVFVLGYSGWWFAFMTLFILIRQDD